MSIGFWKKKFAALPFCKRDDTNGNDCTINISQFYIGMEFGITSESVVIFHNNAEPTDRC